MKRFLCVLVCTCTIGFGVVHAAVSDSVEALRAEYSELLARSKDADPLVDYLRMREIYALLPEYSAYGSCDRTVSTLLQEEKYDAAKVAVEDCLKNEWVHLSIHELAYIIYSQLGDSTRADFHATVYRDIVAAMLRNGDGTSAKTAIDVLYASEEYSYLRYIDTRFTSQALQSVDGSAYDVMTVKDANNNTLSYWFRVDRLFMSMRKMMKEIMTDKD